MWRLGRRVSYEFVSAQLKLRPARQPEHQALIGGNTYVPGAYVPRASVEFS
jgi:hypothetical protein